MKRKVILYIATSVDGFIADTEGKVDWIEGQEEGYDGDVGYGKFINNIDTIIMGYNTYKQLIEELSPNEWVYKGMKSYILTNKNLENTNEVVFVNENIEDLINRLKQEAGKDIWICGGSNIVNQLVEKDLIDEYRITTVPVVLGRGIRLFENNNITIKLKLKNVSNENGYITSSYERRQ